MTETRNEPASEPRVPADSPLRVAMVVHAYYEFDARVRRYAESLVERGHIVDIFALRHPEAEKKFSALAAKFDAAAFYVPVALERAFLTKAEGEYTATLGQFRFGVEAGAVGEGWNEVIADSKEIWLYLSSIPLMSFAYAERYTQVICFDFFLCVKHNA